MIPTANLIDSNLTPQQQITVDSVIEFNRCARAGHSHPVGVAVATQEWVVAGNNQDERECGYIEWWISNELKSVTSEPAIVAIAIAQHFSASVGLPRIEQVERERLLRVRNKIGFNQETELLLVDPRDLTVETVLLQHCPV